MIHCTLTWMIQYSRQHITHADSSIGMAWRPDSTCYETVQLRKVALCHGFSPVEETFNTGQTVAQPFKVVPDEGEASSDKMHAHSQLCDWMIQSYLLLRRSNVKTVWFLHFSLERYPLRTALDTYRKKSTVVNDWIKERRTKKQKLGTINQATGQP